MSRNEKVLNGCQNIGQNNSLLSEFINGEIEFPVHTLSELLQTRAHSEQNREIYHFIETTLEKRKSLTYGELYHRASKIASHLMKTNPSGEPVLLLFNCDLDYLAAFFGCLLAGHIAVPAYPPTASKHFERLQSIIESSEAKVALTSREIHALMSVVDQEKMEAFPLHFICTDYASLEKMTDNVFKPVHLNPNNIAFLQYTSGSTGNPKGVMLSHRALLTNLRMIKNNYKYTSQDRMAMWLPLYHDMGLIGGVLTALYINAPLYFMPPQSIVRPYKWLKLMSDMKATVSGGPNFAFDMCLHRISDQEMANLNLSSLRFIASGAEPVRKQTVQRFFEKFRQVGLRENVIVPCYGLAETCVYGLSRPVDAPIQAISVDPKILQENGRAVIVDLDFKNKIEYVSCGILTNNQDAKVIDPMSLTEKSHYDVGELLLSGQHLMTGYWKNEKASQETLINIKGRTFLRTGDLVFSDEKNNIYFCGRNKDMIIVRGKNYYSTDIEISVNKSHPGLGGMVNASFSVEKADQEMVILVQEIPFGTRSKDLEFIRLQIQQQVVDDHNLHFDEILFVNSGTIKRTSAGKIRRLATKDLYLNGKIQAYKEPLIKSKLIQNFKKRSKKYKLLAYYLISKTKIHHDLVSSLVEKSIFKKNLFGRSNRP